MPYKLVEPKLERSPYWRVRGTEHGVYCDRSTQTRDRKEAQSFLRQWREEAKRIAISGPKPEVMTFSRAAIGYMQSGRDKRFLAQLLVHFKDTPIVEIDQAAIDAAAVELYPDAAPATRNRQVYSPMSAILKHAGVVMPVRRPRGWRSRPRPTWLRPEQAFSLLEAAMGVDARLGALMTFLLYCGPRLSEALRLEWSDVDLERATAGLSVTKNGDPMTLHLPPSAVAAIANLEGRKGRVFRLTKCGRLYALLSAAEKAAGLTLPPGAAFHALRHTHATWRRLFTGADTKALTATGLWKSREAASVYEHVEASEEARKSDMFPTR